MELGTAVKLLNMYLELNPHRHDMGTAVKTVLKELDTLQMNYKLLEEKFDGSAEEKVDKLTSELYKQKEIKAEMRKIAFEEGFEQGRIKGIMEAVKEG